MKRIFKLIRKKLAGLLRGKGAVTYNGRIAMILFCLANLCYENENVVDKQEVKHG